MHLEHDEAFFFICALMKHADGRVRLSEEAVAERLLHDRGIHISDVRARVLDARGRAGVGPEVLDAVCAALPTPTERRDALMAAVDVMWADHDMDARELAVLSQMSAALGVEPVLA